MANRAVEGTACKLRLQVPSALRAPAAPHLQRWASQSMRRLFAFSFTAVMCGSLAGCCAFMPCHPATSLVGAVRDTNGLPVANATVTMYGATTATDSRGCFNVHRADAMPFTFSVAAAGYQSAQVEAQAGFYRVSAKLARTQSPDQSQIEWVAISPNEYSSSTPCEH